MANRFFGEATIENEGQQFTLRLDFNAMCHFEELTGKDAMETLQGFENGVVSASAMRALMWAFLKHHHPEITVIEAGEILSRNLDALEEVMVAAMPSAEDTADLGKSQKTKGKAAA